MPVSVIFKDNLSVNSPEDCVIDVRIAFLSGFSWHGKPSFRMKSGTKGTVPPVPLAFGDGGFFVHQVGDLGDVPVGSVGFQEDDAGAGVHEGDVVFLKLFVNGFGGLGIVGKDGKLRGYGGQEVGEQAAEPVVGHLQDVRMEFIAVCADQIPLGFAGGIGGQQNLRVPEGDVQRAAQGVGVLPVRPVVHHDLGAAEVEGLVRHQLTIRDAFFLQQLHGLFLQPVRKVLREGRQELVDLNVGEFQQVHFSLQVVVVGMGVVHDVKVRHAVLFQIWPETLPVRARAAVDHHELAAALNRDGLVGHFLIECDFEQVPLLPVGGFFLPTVIHIGKGCRAQQGTQEQQRNESAQNGFDLHGLSFRKLTCFRVGFLFVRIIP